MPLPQVIAIDGPSGSGKSTIGALLAERLGYVFVDTGALYRALTLLAIEQGVSHDNGATLAAIAARSRISIGPPTVRDGRAYTVLADGRDITWSIRDPLIDRAVPEVARHPEVRDQMLEQQRSMVEGRRAVVVGRDIGTVVLPDAPLKIYLTASAAERATRRGDELKARGVAHSRAELLADILQRDSRDIERPVAPLRPADDAVIIETDGLSVADALTRVLAIVTAA